jgi:hypothetical protein
LGMILAVMIIYIVIVGPKPPNLPTGKVFAMLGVFYQMCLLLQT